VFSIDGRNWTQQQLLDYLESKQRREATQPISPYVQDHFKQYVDDEILAYEDSQLEKKYPEFRMLMKDTATASSCSSSRTRRCGAKP